MLPVNLTQKELESINKINDLPKCENKLEKLFEILGITDSEEDKKIKARIVARESEEAAFGTDQLCCLYLIFPPDW